MSSFSFVMTEQCNWNCKYCYFPHIKKQKQPNIKTYEKHIPYIAEIMKYLNEYGLIAHIEIQGGEVGLVDIELMRYFFDNMPFNNINVSTNGEFLRRGYHLDNRIRNKIIKIMWHVTDNFSEIKRVKDYTDNTIPISRGIVHNNANEMLEFIKINDHILFDYVEFEFDITKVKKADISLYQDFYSKIKNLKNLTDYAKFVIFRRLSEKENHRDNCRNYNSTVIIDLVNETIPLCQRQQDINIKLSKENLIYRLTNFPKNIYPVDKCFSCTRLYSGKFSGNIIERTLKIKKRLSNYNV